MTPSSVLLMIASSEDSTIAASRLRTSSASLTALMSFIGVGSCESRESTTPLGDPKSENAYAARCRSTLRLAHELARHRRHCVPPGGPNIREIREDPPAG